MPDMKDPATWPFRLLPVVRRTLDPFPECGVLLPGLSIVYLVNLTEATPQALMRCDRLIYEDFDELAGDGWLVD